MLVAAQNPYPAASTTYDIEYGGEFVDQIQTEGFNVYLGICSLTGGGCE